MQNLGVFTKSREALSDAILSLLSRERGYLSTKAIHAQLKKKGLQVTYQAAHKTLNKMVYNKILTKKGMGYGINLEWALQLEKFAKNIKNACMTAYHVQLAGLQNFKEVDNIKIFEFDSLGNAEGFRKYLQIEYLENNTDIC